MTAPTKIDDTIEFCPTCATEAHVYLPGRWSVGAVYRCPTASCSIRYRFRYTADPADPRILGSVLVELSD
ncbi:MAG: hypothetical protein ACJA07_004487 [Rhodococcus sp. (in: high G+C Gram-positive bacteria)]|jgi:hypothetical protein